MSLVAAKSRAALSRRQFLAACGRAAPCALLGAAAGRTSFAAPVKEAYDGMHDGAAWRHAAMDRIERERKQDFLLMVVDSAGNTIPNASVEIELNRHDFGFGGGLKLSRFFDEKFPEEIREQYKSLASRLFHKTVALNGFKWKHIDNNLQYVDQFLAWCEASALPVRGHTLVWPRFRRAPAAVSKLADKPDELRATIRAHINRMVTSYRGRIVEWDVLNEPFTEHEYMDILGETAAVDWFVATQEDDPDALRYINDFGVLTRPNKKHQDHYFDYAGWLLDQGAPLQGIGFQAHNPADFPLESPENMLETLDRFAGHGLDLQITEFDVERTDRELQARYTMDFMIAVFSHPATVGLLTWTPFEYGSGMVSKPEAAMYDRNLQPRPNGEVWDLLVNQHWRTRESGATSATGTFDFRGFPGTYGVRVMAGSVAHTATAEFLPHQTKITVELDQRIQ